MKTKASDRRIIKKTHKDWTMCHEMPFNDDELNVIMEAARILTDSTCAIERIMKELNVSVDDFHTIFGRLNKYLDVSNVSKESVTGDPVAPDDLPQSGMNGFSRNKLIAAFGKVQKPDDWKAPINSVIDKADESIVEAAISFFTSTPADFSPVKGQRDKWRVKSIGYREGPAGDH